MPSPRSQRATWKPQPAGGQVSSHISVSGLNGTSLFPVYDFYSGSKEHFGQPQDAI